MCNIFSGGDTNVARACDENVENNCHTLNSQFKEITNELSGNACKTAMIPGTQTEVKVCANGCFTVKTQQAETTMCCCKGDR